MTAPTLNASRRTKKTHFGEIPVDWGVSKLDHVAVVQTGLAKGKKGIKNPVTLPYLRVANVQDGYFDLREVKTITVERSEIDRYRVRKNDVLLTEGGDLDKLGRGHLWDGQIDPCLHQNHVFVVRTRPEVLLPAFFALQTAGPYGRRYFLSCAKQTTNLASVNSTQLKHFPVLIPPLREQHKITAILGAWDRAIERAEKLASAKQQLKRGLARQLLTGKKRFPEFKSQPWRQVRLGDVLKEVERPIPWEPDTLYHLLSVRRRSGGLFSRESLRGREIKTQNLCMAKAGDFLISRMQVVHGASGLTTQEFDGMTISGSYDALVTKDPNVLDIEFFNCLSQCPQLYRIAFLASHGVHIEKMSFNLHHYLKFKIRIPPTVKEQAKIVAVIDACNRELKLLTDEADRLREQKKGLMQKLLTGKVRVKT